MAAPACEALRMLPEHNLAPRQFGDLPFAAQDGDLAAGKIELPGMLCSRAAGPRLSDQEPLVLDAAKSAVEVDVVTGSPQSGKMEAWRCVRRGYGRCVVGRGRSVGLGGGREEGRGGRPGGGAGRPGGTGAGRAGVSGWKRKRVRAAMPPGQTSGDPEGIGKPGTQPAQRGPESAERVSRGPGSCFPGPGWPPGPAHFR